MAKNQVPEKVPKYRFAVWEVWYKTVHLKVCKIVECEMLGIVCLRIKITLLEPIGTELPHLAEEPGIREKFRRTLYPQLEKGVPIGRSRWHGS